MYIDAQSNKPNFKIIAELYNFFYQLSMKQDNDINFTDGQIPQLTS